jgi:streptogramin lyase
MRIGVGIRYARLAVVSTVALVALVVCQVEGRADGATLRGGWLPGSPLVISGAQALLGGQLESAAEEARHASPEAVAARERSRTAYAHLSAMGVGSLLRKVFPGVIERPAGGVPGLPMGARITGYPSSHAAQLALPGHQLGILESSWPIAKRGSHGRFAPINLALSASRTGYVPVRSNVDVQIPNDLSAGIRTPGNGLTVTPVDSRGRPLTGSRGSVEGASVVYANTQQATDTFVKPTPSGFELDAVLRSAGSPQQILFKIGAPGGVKLTQVPGSGIVRVRLHGATLATILPPGAEDAAGTNVPASMSVAGHSIVVSVAHRAGSYLYPIDVDPEVNDSQLATTSGGKRSNWVFKSSNETKFGHSAVYEGAGKERLETTGIAEYKATEFAYWAYETKGNSKIYELKTKTSAKNKSAKIESFLEFQSPSGGETKKILSTELSEPEYTEKVTTICAWNASKVEECLPASGKEKNAVRFQQSATASPGSNFKFSDTLSEGIVSISEPSGEHSTTSYNTTSPEFEFEVEGKPQKRTNALYGAGIWLTKFKGALQFIAKDPGIGVSATRLEYEKAAGSWENLSEHHYLEAENACQGVQCYPEHAEYWTVDPKLPDGEDKIRYRAEEAIAGTVSLASEAESTKTVKVDTAAPHNIFLGGLPWGDELTEKPYKLSATAIDGVGSTVASSGIKRLALFVSGHEITELGTQTGCAVPKGECLAKAEWSINGAELGAGHHAIVIVATDNAGNEARVEETISIRHSTPVPLGPGSADLQSGDFALGGTDVSMGSGLTVGRNYSSRATKAGIEGPLGPQWSLNLGTTESLVEMVDGSVLLTDAKGEQTIFASLGEGQFEAPTGDSNLKLTLEENKETKQKLAYYLENVANKTKTKFTLPSGGTKVWAPTRQEGTVATDSVTYTYQTAEQHAEYPLAPGHGPSAITLGPDGNLWFVGPSNFIGKITTSGAITEYTLPENSFPGGITAGSDGNLWFTDASTNKIGKITTSGVITEYALPEKSTPAGITAGPDGNLWFTEQTSNKVGKITTSGAITEYSIPSNNRPYAITAGPDGNLWFTVLGSFSSDVDKITTSGVFTVYKLPEGNTSPEAITAGPDGELWFVEYNLNKLDKITTSGTITEYSLPSGSKPQAITSGPDGNLWFVDNGTSKIGKVTTAGVVTEYKERENSSLNGIVTGPDGNLWFTAYFGGAIGTLTPTGTITEPTEALAPVPAGISCSPMKAGCRALKFTYATGTTANGENQSQWGEYLGRLKKVLMDAYNPSSKIMQETAVAEYSYDKRGRLRAEWDPRVSPALKSTYGYDAEGHVTAMNPPGQESWAFTYGPIAGDSGTGRLLKVARAPASEALWAGESVANTEVPKISGSTVAGVRLAVSNGKWSGGPITYGYQWESCDSGGKCTSIAGANNANYTPTSGDVGHTLVALVTATNGGGSTVTASTASTVVTAGGITQSVDSGNSLNAVSCIPGTTDCVASDSKGNAFYATNVSATSTASWNAWSGPAGVSPSEAVACPTTSLCLLADGSDSGYGGNMYYAKSLGGAWTLAYAPSYGVDAISCSSASFCVDGQDGFGYFRYSTSPASTSWTLESQGSATMKSAFCLSSSFCAIADSVGTVHVATSTAQVESSSWTTTNVDGTSALNGVACTSTTSCLAIDGAGNVLNLAIAGGGGATASKHNIDGANSLTAITCTGSTCVVVDNKGNVFTSANSGETWTERYQFKDNMTSVSCSSSTLCVTVDTAGSTAAFNPAGGGWTEGELHSPQVGGALEYGVPLSGTGLPTMTSGEVAKWGQTDAPVEATAIMPPDADQGWPASNYTRASVYYMDSRGRNVNVSNPSTATYRSVSTTEYNELNDLVRTLSPDNRQTALEAGSKSAETAKLLATYSTYREECSKESENKHEAESTEPGSRLCETEGPQHEVKYLEGSTQKESLARMHTKYFYDENAPSGETYNLLTKTSTIAQLANEEEREVRKTTTSYSGQSNLGWKLRAPTSVTVDPEGKKLTTTTLYNSTTGQITETRAPAGTGGGSAHDTKLIYYTAEANTEGYSACGVHPEWAGLVCETLPAKQPESGGLPQLPVTTTTYNIWNEPLVMTETFGSTVRTKTKTYDEAGRLTSSETTSTANTALPKVTDEYNSKTGVLENQKTTVEGKTTTITSKYSALGQLTEYTDADGNIAKYRYAGPENDWLLEEMTDGSNAGTGKQTYTYNATTKLREGLLDSAAGTFTAAYDAEGKLTSEVYPNAMCANYTRNSVGEATHIEYIKTMSCSEHEAPVWYSETRNPSVRGETFSRTSTLASETYAYDTVGRLTEAHETPAGEGCSTRLYGYDEESNRTSQTTRAPGGEGKCATEGGTVQNHTYDEGNRLTDTGISYDVFGNVTKLPASDAEGHELSSTFYVDNAIATQSQNGVSDNYYLDPEGRVRETVSGANAIVTHYDIPGEAVAWTSESGGKSTRNIPGIDGSMSATQTNGATPVLQLHDLQGDVVATAALSTTETKVLSTYNSTEFGVPNAGKAPPKFAWLGAADVASAFSSGVITYGATSYVPQTGRVLQSEAVEPPGAPVGSGAGEAYTSQEEPWVFQGAAAEGTEAPGLEAAREQAALEAAIAAAVDPKEFVYMNKTKAREKAGELFGTSILGQLASILDIPAGLVEAALDLGTGIAMESVYGWFEEAADKLWKCGNNKWIVKGKGVNICRLQYDVIEAKNVPLVGTVKFVNFLSEPYVWECFKVGDDPCFHEVFIPKPEEEGFPFII